jgi:hypothetical protein
VNGRLTISENKRKEVLAAMEKEAQVARATSDILASDARSASAQSAAANIAHSTKPVAIDDEGN